MRSALWNKGAVKTFKEDSFRVTPAVLVLSMLFISCLITSNLLVIKIMRFSFPQGSCLNSLFPQGLQASCGILPFPMTYFLGDILTEVYGFKTSRCVIWIGLMSMVIVSSFLHLSIVMPSSSVFVHQEAYETLFRSSFRITIASIVAYFFGELVNALLMSWLKVKTKGKHLWLRAFTSTFVGNVLDTFLFCMIVYTNVLALQDLLHISCTELALKVLFELGALPLTYWLSSYLKRHDRTDVYDTGLFERSNDERAHGIKTPGSY